MLKSTDSPQNALNSLCNWLALPETQEVLNLLRLQSQTADKLLKRSPLAIRLQINGEDTAPDGATIEQFRNQCIGEFKGLVYLENYLNDYEAELIETVKRQEKQN